MLPPFSFGLLRRLMAPCRQLVVDVDKKVVLIVTNELKLEMPKVSKNFGFLTF
jgi:hypothetical protein